MTGSVCDPSVGIKSQRVWVISLSRWRIYRELREVKKNSGDDDEPVVDGLKTT